MVVLGFHSQLKGGVRHAENATHQNEGAAGRQDRDRGPGSSGGESVDVVVSQSAASERRSAVDILAEAPGGLAFKTAADVAAYLKEKKQAWDR